MHNRIAQFISVLSLAILLIGGVLGIFSGTSKYTRSLQAFQQLFETRHHSHSDKVAIDHRWEQQHKNQHTHDSRAIEKPEESDLKPSTANENLASPLLALLLHKDIAFSLFSLLYNNKPTAAHSALLITCFDSERFMLFQDFRI
ncbi:hypothetical protein [Sphingobacterium griseoflavum]|uniref:Uncharacterized protein n=1 Tax=Sphingobacterium griseoflavum TaxID=1474952 RepID=A0ABQ3HVF0_9SPHI|nr:hypothetical protein [Sphingobacterium griseoflavum]GHE23368.1 hypothetical protein GCM10017764_03360 [Sphingobacterium griseoflavum]